MEEEDGIEDSVMVVGMVEEMEEKKWPAKGSMGLLGAAVACWK